MADALDLDALEAAYRGHGYDHSGNRLLRELRAAIIEIAGLKRKFVQQGMIHMALRQEIARLKTAKPTEGEPT